MRRTYLLFAGCVVLVVVLWLVSWFLTANGLPGWTERSAFGGMFGAVGALFSGLAFAGLIVAILLQAKQIELQQQQLQDTKDELRAQNQQISAQNETLKQQRFESTFFQLLKLHTEIVNAIDPYSGSVQRRKRRGCFVQMYQEFRNKYQENMMTNKMKGLSGINEVYCLFYPTHQADLGHYFRNLYHLIRFVHRSDIQNKRDYTI